MTQLGDLGANVNPDQTWRRLAHIIPGSTVNPLQAAGTYLLGINAALRALDASSGASSMFALDPADFTAGGWAARVRLRAWIACNTTDPAIGAWTVALNAVTALGGASVDPAVHTIGANVCSVNVTPVAAPAVPVPVVGADVAFPAAGLYVFTVVLPGATTANSDERVFADLQVQRS